jgi:hypothetical protein
MCDARQKLYLFLFLGVFVFAFGQQPALAQDEPESLDRSHLQVQAQHIGVPIDWSTRHIVFTNGASAESRMAAAGDPRSWINWATRSTFLFHSPRPESGPPPQLGPRRKSMRVDWAMPLGTAGGMPIGESPAKYSFNITGYNCTTDYAVFVINATPGSTQANVVALNNLYTGTASSSCPFGPQTPPTTDYKQPTWYWSYQVGNGPVYLSPVLSIDGSKVGFVESSTTNAMFDVLTWVAGQGTSATAPATPGSGGSSVTRLDYTNVTNSGCSASASKDSNSSPYVDYNNDVAYVGADNGKLYRITGAFKGTPTVQYCVTVKANALLTSPVYDQVTNQVFVSDGYSVYSFTPGASSFTASGSIAVASTKATDPIILSPIVDSTNGFVYVFSSADSTDKFAAVSQINLALTSQSVADIGPVNTTSYILDGDFDNAYFANGPKTGAGTLYACGTQTAAANKPALYALTFANTTGLLNATPAISSNMNLNGASNPVGSCSPLLDFFDGTTDRLFVGAGNYNATTGANMVTQWNTTTRMSSSTSTPNATATGYWGGSSAFTIDNISTAPQAASIYFGTLQPPASGTAPCGAGNYCAVKLTQSALQ